MFRLFTRPEMFYTFRRDFCCICKGCFKIVMLMIIGKTKCPVENIPGSQAVYTCNGFYRDFTVCKKNWFFPSGYRFLCVFTFFHSKNILTGRISETF